MSWPGEERLHLSGQDHRDEDPEDAILGLSRELDAHCRELGHRGRDVVAEERDLLRRGPGRVDAEFCRREVEDQPTRSVVVGPDVVPAEGVPQSSRRSSGCVVYSMAWVPMTVLPRASGSPGDRPACPPALRRSREH